ncbi:MAG: methyltransferase [Candidatus Nanoarchaeia archaeon]
MNGLIITQQGLEPIAELEVKELLPKVKTTKLSASVLVEVKDITQLCKIAYRAQSITKVLLLVAECKPGEHIKALEASNIKDYISPKTTFSCRAGVHDSYESTMELSEEIGGQIKVITEAKVNLTDPKVRAYVYATKKTHYIGIDLSGTDLSKRDYRVFKGMEQLKATTTYAAVRFAGYNKEMKLVDPFCRSATLPIETALHATYRSPHFFAKEKLAFHHLPGDWDAFFEIMDDEIDEGPTSIVAVDQQNKNISAAKKNAKIAAVNKNLTFSKMDLDWLETRFDEKSVDLIVTSPPEKSKTMREPKVRKLQEELFYQAAYILNDNGNVTVIVRDPATIIESAKSKGFKETKRMPVAQGHEVFFIITFERAS